MTVAELIAELQKVEKKNVPVTGRFRDSNPKSEDAEGELRWASSRVGRVVLAFEE